MPTPMWPTWCHSRIVDGSLATAWPRAELVQANAISRNPTAFAVDRRTAFIGRLVLVLGDNVVVGDHQLVGVVAEFVIPVGLAADVLRVVRRPDQGAHLRSCLTDQPL